MKRFIFLTFGFMGWAFYEMSGGADFVPAGSQTASAEAAEAALIASANPSSNLVTKMNVWLSPSDLTQKLVTVP